MHLGDLAFELQLKVAQLCSLRDLTSLSRVHTSLRDVADFALYSGIYCSSFSAFLSILQTLTANKQKASLVKVLDIELIHVGVDNLRVQSLEVMAGMLSNMLNLHKLRISVAEEFQRSGGDSGGINQAIMFVFIQATIISGMIVECSFGLVQGWLFPTPDSMSGGESVSLGGYQGNCRQPVRSTTPWVPPAQ